MAATKESETAWACSMCTYENEESSKWCRMCRTAKPGSEDGWKCVLCTFSNMQDAAACEVCSAPSPAGQDLTGKQICGSCTFVNCANANKCTICNQTLTQKVIQMGDNGQLQQIDMDVDQELAQSSNAYNKRMDNQFAQDIDENQIMFPSANNIPSKPQSRKSKKSKGRHKRDHHHQKKQNAEGGNKQSNDLVKFKDVEEIFKKDANDKDRIKLEQQSATVLFEWYSYAYLTKERKYEPRQIQPIVSKMIRFIPKEHLLEVEKNTQKSEQKSDPTVCQVCYCEFDQEDGKVIQMKHYCEHAMICQGCFLQHLKIKVQDDDITPWIPCAATNCKAPVCAELLFQYLDTKELYKFAQSFLRRHLARNENWVRCQTKNCEFGWIIIDQDTSKQYKLKCKACKKTQTICKDPVKCDNGFNELIKSGVLRLCPKCKLPTMKDKGMCNIMHCGKCGIYWNWQTNETGTSSSQLKNKARGNGTLWEPGELAYQRRLQQTNLPEFVNLLERNGVKYDPNYVRGTR